MQSVSPRIWTRVTVSISDDDNHYTTGTSLEIAILDYMFYFDKIKFIKVFIVTLVH